MLFYIKKYPNLKKGNFLYNIVIYIPYLNANILARSYKIILKSNKFLKVIFVNVINVLL